MTRLALVNLEIPHNFGRRCLEYRLQPEEFGAESFRLKPALRNAVSCGFGAPASFDLRKS